MVRRIASAYERHPDRVDDLVQEVWIAVMSALPRLHDHSLLKHYVARITQNICVTHIRRAVVREAVPIDGRVIDPAPTPDETAAGAIRLARLIDAVRALPDNLKAVATLYLEEMPVKEIAALLGISETNVSVRLNRAKAALRQSMGETT